ncbi:MAG: hypothetical protein D6689_04925 [Deltaproteobacteria bacterium]|nr:MAG: hypothetical protein D6689_04925 [Deltaproteobacteria bacterium]
MEPVKLPPARALREGSRLAPRPRGPTVATRLSYAMRRARPGAALVLAYAWGLFPLIAPVLLAFGLAWGSALGASP